MRLLTLPENMEHVVSISYLLFVQHVYHFLRILFNLSILLFKGFYPHINRLITLMPYFMYKLNF